MKRTSIYLKLQVIGAVDSEEGPTVISRIRKVAKRTFHDEEGRPRVYTWRTIQTWVSLYRQGGVDMLNNRPRRDKGSTRKVEVEQLSGAIEKVLPEFRDGRYNRMEIYRRCIMHGLISKQECSQTSFFRLVKEYDLLTPQGETHNRRRLAFSKQYANEMWQLDTMFGPFIKNGRVKTQAKLIAFIDDASRIIPHGEFFFEETRAVRKDNTFQVAGRRYEAPRNLANTKICVRYDRTSPGRIIVFFKNQRMGEAHLLDPVANDRPPKPQKGKDL